MAITMSQNTNTHTQLIMRVLEPSLLILSSVDSSHLCVFFLSREYLLYGFDPTQKLLLDKKIDTHKEVRHLRGQRGTLTQTDVCGSVF